MTNRSDDQAHIAEKDAALWVVTKLSLSLPEPPPEGDAHPETTPVGPFSSRKDADAWAFAYVGQFRSGSWSIAPLRTPPSVLPPGGSGELVGQKVMSAMTCTHEGDTFGSGAACDTCFANTQRIGALIEQFAARAWDQGRDAERRDWEFTDDREPLDEERQSWVNPYRALPPVTRVLPPAEGRA